LSVAGRIVVGMLNWLRAILLGEDAIMRELRAQSKARTREDLAVQHRFDVLAKQVDQTNIRLHRMEQLAMANQDQIDAYAARLGATTDGIRSDIADLKQQITNGTPAQELDFSALESRVAGLEGLDAENPATPVDPGTPAV
jgi:hypothetical protein